MLKRSYDIMNSYIKGFGSRLQPIFISLLMSKMRMSKNVHMRSKLLLFDTKTIQRRKIIKTSTFDKYFFLITTKQWIEFVYNDRGMLWRQIDTVLHGNKVKSENRNLPLFWSINCRTKIRHNSDIASKYIPKPAQI
jgi:hypothetical protein